MDNLLPLAMILSVRGTRAIAHSALPTAPVLPDEPARRAAGRIRAVRPRAALARALRAAATAVAPDQAEANRAGTSTGRPGTAPEATPCVPA